METRIKSFINDENRLETFIKSIASKWCDKSDILEYEDLVQEGYVAYLEALRSRPKGSGVLPDSHIESAVTERIQQAIREMGPTKAFQPYWENTLTGESSDV